ncbi:MAG: TIGR01212 family radical SAM protein, partial [Sphingobacteriaceae bacterium]
DLDLLIAPNWNLKKSEIQFYIDRTIQTRGIVQGSALNL